MKEKKMPILILLRATCEQTLIWWVSSIVSKYAKNAQYNENNTQKKWNEIKRKAHEKWQQNDTDKSSVDVHPSQRIMGLIFY